MAMTDRTTDANPGARPEVNPKDTMYETLSVGFIGSIGSRTRVNSATPSLASAHLRLGGKRRP